MKINDYMAELAKYDFATNFGEYDSGYICDIITEIADNNVSVYTQEQIDFAMNNQDAVNEAFFSGIAPDASAYMKNGGDFYGYIAAVGAAAWYESNVSAMYKNLNECVLYAVCSELMNQYGIKELTDEQISDLEFIDFDNNDRLEDAVDEAAEAIGFNSDDDDEEDED